MKKENTRNFSELTYTELKNSLKNKKRLVFPVGTLEAHGKFLPLGTDAYNAEFVAIELAKKINSLIAPTLFYGITDSLFLHGGASTYDHDLYESFIKKTLENFISSGFKEIIIVNGHAGNFDPLQRSALALMKEKGVFFIVLNWWVFTLSANERVYGEIGGHSGVEETAGILAYRPDLVKPHLFSRKDITARISGYKSYPSDGTIILEKKNKGLPNFDKKKAEEFMKLTISEIAKRVRESLDYFKREFK